MLMQFLNSILITEADFRVPIISHCIALQVLDQRGVGQLIKIATERGRAARPSLKVQ